MALSKSKAALIDLDGTLFTSVPDLALCVDKTMKVLGLPLRCGKLVRNCVGHGVDIRIANPDAVINSFAKLAIPF